MPAQIQVTGSSLDEIQTATSPKTGVKTVAVTHKPKPAKPGYLTTEFWATVLFAVGSIAAAGTSNLPPRYAEIGVAVSVSAYAASRALAKL